MLSFGVAGASSAMWIKEAEYASSLEPMYEMYEQEVHTFNTLKSVVGALVSDLAEVDAANTQLSRENIALVTGLVEIRTSAGVEQEMSAPRARWERSTAGAKRSLSASSWESHSLGALWAKSGGELKSTPDIGALLYPDLTALEQEYMDLCGFDGSLVPAPDGLFLGSQSRAAKVGAALLQQYLVTGVTPVTTPESLGQQDPTAKVHPDGPAAGTRPTTSPSPSISEAAQAVAPNAGHAAPAMSAAAGGEAELSSPCVPLQVDIPHHVRTLVVKHLPVSCTQELLMKMWPPAGSYNLLYLPFSPNQRRRAGYAFVNFVSEEALQLFVTTWQGVALMRDRWSQQLDIKIADVQGLDANLRSFRRNKKMRATRSEQYLPIIIKPDGRKESFRVVMAAMDAAHAAEVAGTEVANVKDEASTFDEEPQDRVSGSQSAGDDGAGTPDEEPQVRVRTPGLQARGKTTRGCGWAH